MTGEEVSLNLSELFEKVISPDSVDPGQSVPEMLELQQSSR